MTLPDIATRDEWRAARKDLLTREKELTRLRDAINADRRRLPMVEVDTDYEFEGRDGKASLLQLFDGRRQLVIQHFMFDPSWDDGCSSCTASCDELSEGMLAHLHARETSFVVVSRAPIAKIEDYKARRGWTFPWYSSYGSDFNYDYHATLDESVTPLELNYRTRADIEDSSAESVQWILDSDQPVEVPGYSCFLRDGDRVFHTNSVYARGTEALGGAYAFLDWTALGRQEDWEEPKGRAQGVRGPNPDFAT